jgi:uncharacterized protein YqeY
MMNEIVSLKNRLQDDMKNAMRAKEAEKLEVIRMVLAAIKQKEIDERIEITDTHVLQAVEKLMKQRKEAMEMFKTGGRDDLVQKEQFAASILQTYLPQALGEAELLNIINAAIAQTGASSAADMGKVMALVKPQAAGKADMSAVSALIKQRLS